jgi:hypothetical protein
MPSFDLIIQPNPAGGYAWALHGQGMSAAQRQGQFRLDTVELKGKPVKFTALDHALTYFDTSPASVLHDFDETAQVQLGKHLYGLLFADAPEDFFPATTPVMLRVVSEDAFIQRVPWNLLAQHKTFLILENWHISVAAQITSNDRQVNFPAAPRVLLVCQAPHNQPATHAQAHGESLLQFFRGRYNYYLNSQALDVVNNWSGFVRKLQEQPWDVIYFYGHGKGDADGAALWFADDEGKGMEVSMQRLAMVLRDCQQQPSLLYLNACRSGSNGIGGAVMQLGERIPALVVNRTDAFTDAAREQARILLERVLLDHYPPHQAITHAYSGKGHGMAHVRWMTPILYQHYSAWTFPHSSVQQFVSKDMHWYLKLDRTPQFSKVHYLTSNMLVADMPSSLICFWYGTPQQGVERFHQRLPIELKKLSPNMQMDTFRFYWPPNLDDPHEAFGRMACEGFGISNLEYLPGMLQDASLGGANTPFVAHCQFATLRRGKAVRLEHVVKLLEWWGIEVHARLRPSGLKALLAFGYELDKPMPDVGKSFEASLKAAKLKAGMRLEILNELSMVSVQDIIDFLNNFEVELAVTGQERERLISKIVDNAQGNYESVLNELQTIVSQAHKLNMQMHTSPVTDYEL